jgi:hypothetical protein
VPGASPHTKKVTHLNANWTPAPHPGGDGTFEVLLITDDERRHLMPASPATITALTAMAHAGTVMLWDPEHDGTLIIANIVGSMPWTRAKEPAS